MPPPSPVWAWDHMKPSAKIYNDAELSMSVLIEGVRCETSKVKLRVKGAAAKKK